MSAVVRGCLLALSCTALPALADEAVSVELVPKALVGAGAPAVVVHALVPVAKLELELLEQGGPRKFHLESKSLGAGKTQRFALELGKPSRAALSGVLYFLSLTVFMLYVNLVLLNRRHWSGGPHAAEMWGHFSVRSLSLAAILIGLNVVASNFTNRVTCCSTTRSFCVSIPTACDSRR